MALLPLQCHDVFAHSEATQKQVEVEPQDRLGILFTRMGALFTNSPTGGFSSQLQQWEKLKGNPQPCWPSISTQITMRQ